MNAPNKTVSVSVRDFKLVVLDEEISDTIILQLFPDVVVESEEDISEVVGILQRHRLALLQQLDRHVCERVV